MHNFNTLIMIKVRTNDLVVGLMINRTVTKLDKALNLLWAMKKNLS